MAELENKATYITMMSDTLSKKKEVLAEIFEATKRQLAILCMEKPNIDEFDKEMTRKNELIVVMTKLDKGFESLYAKVQVELNANRKKYKLQIENMQKLISEITDLSVKIQTTEETNCTKLEKYIRDERNGIKSFKVNSKTAAAYYKSMAGGAGVQAAFLDKKK